MQFTHLAQKKLHLWSRRMHEKSRTHVKGWKVGGATTLPSLHDSAWLCRFIHTASSIVSYMYSITYIHRERSFCLISFRWVYYIFVWLLHLPQLNILEQTNFQSITLSYQSELSIQQSRVIKYDAFLHDVRFLVVNEYCRGSCERRGLKRHCAFTSIKFVVPNDWHSSYTMHTYSFRP